MQINVVNIIIDSLLANGKCSIDGLGTFILNKDLPKVDHKLKKISAPKSTVSFEDSIQSDFKLKDELLKVYPFSDAKAQKVVNLFANKVVNGLINFDSIELSNLGTLKNNKNKNGLEFNLSPILMEVIQASQPEVDLKPFLAAKEDADKKAQEEAHKKAEADKADKLAKKLEKEQTDRRAKAAALAETKQSKAVKDKIPPKVEAVTPAVKTTHNVKTPTPKVTAPVKPIRTKPTAIPSAKETVVPVGSAIVESPISTQPEPKQKQSNLETQVKEKEVYLHEDDKGFFSRYMPWVLLLFLLVGLGWGLKKLINSISFDTDETERVFDDVSQTTTDDIAPADSTDEIKDGEGSEAKTTGSEASKTEKLIQPSECIIITGSYLDQQNMDEMASKIRKMGYEVYTEKYGYYTRVGFKFPCQDVNLKLFIEEIRANISKESWYLVPDLSI